MLLLLLLLLFVVALILAGIVVVAVATLITNTHRSSSTCQSFSPKRRKKKQSLLFFSLHLAALKLIFGRAIADDSHSLMLHSLMSFLRTISSLISFVLASQIATENLITHSANNISQSFSPKSVVNFRLFPWCRRYSNCLYCGRPRGRLMTLELPRVGCSLPSQPRQTVQSGSGDEFGRWRGRSTFFVTQWPGTSILFAAVIAPSASRTKYLSKT